MTIVAEQGLVLAGFIHIELEQHPRWGSLIDNLHVGAPFARRGIGSGLLARGAQATIERGARSGLHLWVLEQNSAARAFYDALRGRIVERAPAHPPGGVAARLTGSPWSLRCAWRSASELLAAAQVRGGIVPGA